MICAPLPRFVDRVTSLVLVRRFCCPRAHGSTGHAQTVGVATSVELAEGITSKLLLRTRTYFLAAKTYRITTSKSWKSPSDKLRQRTDVWIHLTNLSRPAACTDLERTLVDVVIYVMPCARGTQRHRYMWRQLRRWLWIYNHVPVCVQAAQYLCWPHPQARSHCVSLHPKVPRGGPTRASSTPLSASEHAH